MKKRMLAAVIAAVCCISLLSACGMGVVDPNGVNASSAAPVSSAAEEKDVEDTLAGLEEYMTSQGFVSGTAADMNGSLIGAAEKGHRYTMTSGTVEFYEYNLENLNSTAQMIRASVESSGSFEIVGQQVQGVHLSNSGKYLMIYQNTDASEEGQAAAQKLIDAFKTFKSE